jgi:tuftelin-interacting protein 11
MTKEKAMLGDWADDEDDDLYSQFVSHDGRKPKSGKAKSVGADPFGSFMFVSSGVYDLASGKREGEEETPSPAMQMDVAPEAPPKPLKKAKEKPVNLQLGAWERHTKGVGSKMMKKMGWAGKGLGQQESGMIAPIQAVARAAGSGLDEGDYMGIQKSAYRKTEGDQEVVEVEEKIDAINTGQWKKNAPKPVSSAPKIPKVVYKTREEIETEQGIKTQRQMVVDMRAPNGESKMDADMPRIPQFMPELRHNLNHLVDLRVSAIHSLVRKRHYSEEQLKSLKGEESTLSHTIENQKTDISYLEALKERLEILRIGAKSDADFDFFAFFADLKETFSADYEKYRLDSFIFHYVFPKISYDMLPWKPLYQPKHGIETIMKWKALLDSEKSLDDDFFDTYDDGYGLSNRLRSDKGHSSKGKTLNTYQRMVYEVIVPKLRAALNEWDIFNPDPALDLISTWKTALPIVGYNWLLYHVIGGRLKTAVSEYAPSRDLMPLDTWLLPWIPIMGHQHIPDLLEEVRRKLQSIVSQLNAESGVEILKPFQGVLDSHNWAQLMARGVLSKIETLLRAIEVNPAGQQMDAWKEALRWSSLVSSEAFGMALLESGFWKKWFAILGQWLHQEGADLEQVQQWYSSWKQNFPKESLASPFIQPQFRAALQLMLSASGDDELPAISQFVPVKVDLQQVQNKEGAGHGKSARAVVGRGTKPAWQEETLKELLESAAEEAGVLFMNTGRKHEGNQLYMFGRTQIYLERDLLYCLTDGVWQPMSINNLIDIAK